MAQLEGSVEQTAYLLFTHIAFAEKKAISHGQEGSPPNRRYILDTYAECLKTVRQESDLATPSRRAA